MTDITPGTSRTGLTGRSAPGAAGHDAAAVPRSIVKLQYAAARLPLTFLDEHVIARHWHQDAPVRAGFEHWLGSLDLLAGRLLADDEISRRGEALMRQTRDPAQAGGHATDAPASPIHSGQVPLVLPADDQAPDLHDQITAYQEQDDPRRVHQAADEQVTTGNPPSTANEAQTGDAARAAGPPGTPDTPAARTDSIDVTFTLPAEVPADTVALCGEFNDWSAEDTQLKRGSDGSWQATIPLESGRSYRYRYLLDGQRWENDGQADHHVPNALGSTDSVVVVAR
jgi:Carbohydrate-binding module 48 (Isoamylase N-terminal domain)